MPSSPSLRLMLSAGEASGDKHAAALANALIKLQPESDLDLFGAGGDAMRAAGVDTMVDSRELGVIGVAEIARVLARAYRSYRKLIKTAHERRAAGIVLVDWPDFNLRLAKRLHRDGFKIIYYISPQVWAWKRYRLRTIRENVDRMLVILPFEVDFYRNRGIKVDYVGHPLAETVRVTASRDEFCRRAKLDPAAPILALLPGSRDKEVHYHLPAMLDAASRLRGNPACENLQFVLPVAPTIDRAQVDEIASAAMIDLTVIERDAINALGHSICAVVASGTATVEAALLGVPMVIVYKGSEINYRLIRPMIHLDTFGMV
ncbi:MAG TPA: lipid-A-disaccharide synthase, partial [Blastocatellia bacterium]|nr:lipid-A-disaccharide synthase [Blastocatellia bacterium]